jgi:RNA-directed DNA polymerase
MTEMVTSGLMRGRWRRSDGPLEGDTRPKRGETAGPRTPCTPPRLRPTLLVILVNGQWRGGWLLRAVDRRLREELAKLDLCLNEAKSRVVDLTQGEAFGFLGFTFRRLRSRRGRWWVFLAPALKKRTALLRKLQEVFRRWRSQPVRRVIAEINPILRGWVNYFRVGNAARCFSIVRSWVERKVRRHMTRARGRRGFGWKRWSRVWLHTTLGLFADYRVRYWGRA